MLFYWTNFHLKQDECDELKDRFQMLIIIGIVKSIVAWFIIMIIGINLLGFVVRGLLWLPPSIEPFEGTEFGNKLKKEVLITPLQNFIMTLTAFVFTLAWLFALYHFWNVGLVAAAVIIMLSRFPDLLWEIKHGVKVTKNRGPRFSNLFAFEFLLSFPLTWYSLCKWPS